MIAADVRGHLSPYPANPAFASALGLWCSIEQQWRVYSTQFHSPGIDEGAERITGSGKEITVKKSLQAADLSDSWSHPPTLYHDQDNGFNRPTRIPRWEPIWSSFRLRVGPDLSLGSA